MHCEIPRDLSPCTLRNAWEHNAAASVVREEGGERGIGPGFQFKGYSLFCKKLISKDYKDTVWDEKSCALIRNLSEHFVKRHFNRLRNGQAFNKHFPLSLNRVNSCVMKMNVCRKKFDILRARAKIRK